MYECYTVGVVAGTMQHYVFRSGNFCGPPESSGHLLCFKTLRRAASGHSFGIRVLPVSAALPGPELSIMHFLVQCYHAGQGSHAGSAPFHMSNAHIL